jgi:hypothetical protein
MEFNCQRFRKLCLFQLSGVRSFNCQRFGKRSLFQCSGIWSLIANVSEHSVPSSRNRHSVPKCWQFNPIRRRTAQKKTYDIQNMAKVWNQEKSIVNCMLTVCAIRNSTLKCSVGSHRTL